MDGEKSTILKNNYLKMGHSDGDCVVVGKNNVEKIYPYHENGQMSYVVWFAIYRDGEISQRVNSAHIDTVMY